MKTRLARFPFVKTLEQFDFSFQPALNEAQIRELAAARFVANGENILLLGPPGVGKTHLAISLGVAAILQGISVVFFTVADLVDLLEQDAKEDRLKQRLAALCKPKLLILDAHGLHPAQSTIRPVLVSPHQFSLPEREHYPDQQQIVWRMGQCRV